MITKTYYLGDGLPFQKITVSKRTPYSKIIIEYEDTVLKYDSLSSLLTDALFNFKFLSYDDSIALTKNICSDFEIYEVENI